MSYRQWKQSKKSHLSEDEIEWLLYLSVKDFVFTYDKAKWISTIADNKNKKTLQSTKKNGTTLTTI